MKKIKEKVKINVKNCIKKWFFTDLELFLESENKNIIEIHKKINDFDVYITAKRSITSDGPYQYDIEDK